MQLLKYLVLVVLTFNFVFVSCKKDDEQAPDPKAENRRQLGISAEDLLAATEFTSMTVELIIPAGFSPMPETIEALRTFLNERVNKPNGVEVVETNIPPPGDTGFDIDEIREIEDEYRRFYTEGNNIAVSIFFANESADSDTDTRVTLGSAYQNTSMVIYERTLRELTATNPGASLSRLETITIHHEFGHLFGLVNIQNDDIHPGNTHEDADNGRHCIVEDCLMFFESQGLRSNMRSVARSRQGGLPTFDTDLCLQDLRVKGGK